MTYVSKSRKAEIKPNQTKTLCRLLFVFLSRLVFGAGCGIILYHFLIIAFSSTLYMGSYISTHALLNLLNELGIRCEALPRILSVFPNGFNKFNNTGGRMQDFVQRMTLKSQLLANFALKSRDYGFRKRDVLWTSTHNVTT